ncbi:MAG: ABC transporter permease [Candidatus Aureabacteria bacterium]|mgnify:CR=1 FL=1|nr:ABC transporter permease [Candidatus Auribacterota bacterium]NLW94609.1 ATP-binding cassette domain-containing protein [Chlamydiota bacterium]HOE27058.1 ABC transporter permease [bacterium]HQM52142.1 ABC transporter permease [bacterium]
MIEIRGIVKTYRMGAQEVRAVRGVSLDIQAGDFVAIMGPSGSGKSTLLHIIGCLDRPDEGSYRAGGMDLTRLGDDELAAARNRLFGFVFQQFHLLPYADARENVELPLIYAGRRHLRESAQDRLREVGLAARAVHRPSELSGGEQQRVAIARALVNDPPILLADEPTGNLDTASEAEIIAVLERLNREGKTIVVVTHEAEIAAHAARIIRMRDGAVVSDERVRGTGRPLRAEPEEAPGDLHAPGEGAVIADHLRQALRAILTHPMRSALSMLGILIGVAAVIAMLALGGGARESIRQRLASMGSNLLRVRAGSHRRGAVALEAGSVTRLNFKDLEDIARLPDIRRISPSVTGRAQAVYGNRNWNTQVEGTGVEYEGIRASSPTAGRFFTEDDVRGRRKVALVGATVARELFGDSSPVGSIIKLNRVNFQVIGLLPEKGAMGPRDQDDTVIVPVTTAMYRLLGKDYLDSLYVEVAEASRMHAVEDEIKARIVKNHRLSKENEDSFEIRNMAEMQEALESTTKTMTWLLGSIAAISLLVGGIGIMNIMLVSVTERTREIGLRKALGARYADIMYQFLIESVVMTVSGGAAGVALGIGASMLITVLAGWAVKVSAASIALATLFSIVVGLVFGVWPARRAASLNPIEALRYE